MGASHDSEFFTCSSVRFLIPQVFTTRLQSVNHQREQGKSVRSRRWLVLIASIVLLVGCESEVVSNALKAVNVATVADWVGIAGFMVSIKVWWTTRSLSQKFLNLARIPELTKDLVKVDKKLLAAVQAGNLDEVGGIASELNSSLDNVAGKVGLWQRWDIWRLRWKLRDIRSGSSVQVAQARHIHDELQGIIKTLEHIEKDSKWER